MTTAPLTPTVLAEEIGVSPKSLRGYLRTKFPRTQEAKNTSWIVTDDAADAARAHFAKQEAKAPDAPDTEEVPEEDAPEA